MNTIIKAKIYQYLLCLITIGLALSLKTGQSTPDKTQAILWSNQCLLQGYDFLSDLKLKTWDLRVTDDLFIRFKKKYENGKQEYYSLNIKEFKKVIFTGDENAGSLEIDTQADNVIKQTFHDPDGDMDTLMRALTLPVKKITRAQADSLTVALNFLKEQK